MRLEGTALPERDALASSEIEMTSLDVLDHDHVEWERVRRTAFLIHQHFRYEYPGPIEDLNHRLIVVPPERHLDQRRLIYRVDVSADAAECATRRDGFGNVILDVRVPWVEEAIDFEAWIVAERRAAPPPPAEDRADDPDWFEPSSRTQADEALRRVAREVREAGGDGLGLARRINDWVYRRLRYAHGITDVQTAAAEALAAGGGVCQDFAHVMLALCRLCGLPARYVSGHLLGEGGTHAWVEVLLPGERGEGAVVWPFDPTHGREPGLSYVTVAVGRDYADVAPTSGTFRAAHGGRLSARKRVGLTAVDYE
jgi:transglutaminase-like putative cysteine protease